MLWSAAEAIKVLGIFDAARLLSGLFMLLWSPSSLPPLGLLRPISLCDTKSRTWFDLITSMVTSNGTHEVPSSTLQSLCRLVFLLACLVSVRLLPINVARTFPIVNLTSASALRRWSDYCSAAIDCRSSPSRRVRIQLEGTT